MTSLSQPQNDENLKTEYEENRIKMLKSCNILDTGREDSFDAVVHILGSTFKVPIALISLLDENRLWFKAKEGVGFQEVPRSLTICAHTILYDTVTVIPDLTKDKRFTDYKNVTGEIGARFYAGAPIVVEGGFKLGAVCILDTAPRHDFSPRDIAKLEEYATIVSNMIMMRRRLSLAVQKDEAQNEYLHNLGHELKTPMGVIGGLSKILLSSSDVPADKKRLLKIMQDSVETLSGIISTMNDMTLIEKKSFDLKKTRFSLRKLLMEMRRMLEAQLELKKLDLEFDTGAVKDILLYTDRVRLKQVLANLLTNAIKYTDEGGITLKALNHSPHLNDPKFIEIQIQDTGIGIPQGEMVRLFERFSRTSRAFGREGAGLGLAISKQIITQMGGQIGVEARAGGGSTFWFALPKPGTDA